MTDDIVQIRRLAETLLALAEAQAETDLSDIRARQRFRREIHEELDTIKDALERLGKRAKHEGGREDDPSVLTRSEAKEALKKMAPWLVSAGLAALHFIRSYIHHF